VSMISPPTTADYDPRLMVTPRLGAAAAMRRHPLVVLLPVLLLAGLGVALGLQRQPTYTATAEDVVQALSPSVAQLPGAIQAAQDLASNQSRLIDSEGIAGPLARQLGTSAGVIENDLSATPVPNSTVIKIEAQSSRAGAAVALANAAAAQFARYVNAQVQDDATAGTVLKQYQAASAAYVRAVAAKQGVGRAGAPSSQTAVVQTTAAVDAAQVRKQALSAQYQSLVQSQATAPKVVPFVTARDVSSDRRSRLEIYVFAGVVGGLLIGAALAMLIANRRAGRATV
jgi:capsular polysaccharide biosynthesis protein